MNLDLSFLRTILVYNFGPSIIKALLFTPENLTGLVIKLYGLPAYRPIQVTLPKLCGDSIGFRVKLFSFGAMVNIISVNTIK